MWDLMLTCLYSRSTTCTHVGFEGDVLVLTFHYMHSCGIWGWRVCTLVPLHALIWDLKLTCVYSGSTTCTHVGFEVDVFVFSFHYMHSCGIWSWSACTLDPLHALMWDLKLTCLYSRSTTCTHVGFEVDALVVPFHSMYSCGIWSWRACTLVHYIYDAFEKKTDFPPILNDIPTSLSMRYGRPC
jgi:hypothetical protein